ncbi:DUF1648 domain-containing protein [Kineococcus sp. SYSU DK002]|uniref:DUF1648 domain-containing protein n=1 Tax=Kineococcus sp. SYSU DK002 TaxID=3383123 RepID=UPI003D7D0D0C
MSRNVTRRVLVLFVTTAVLACAAVVWAATVLPQRVPTHFAGAGEPDAWSSATGAVVFLAALTVGLVATFSALVRWVPRVRWEWVNVPRKQEWIDAGLEGELRRRLRVDLLVLGTAMNVFAGSVTLAVVQAARSADHALPGWWFVVLVAWLVFTVVHAVVMHAVRYRLPVGTPAS